MLRVDGIRVSFGSVVALHDVSLAVNEGEVVSVLGANGAGKTTLLSAVMGLVAPTEGEITFERRSLLGRSPDKIAREGIAFIPEGRHIFGTLTVKENLIVGASTRGRANPEDLERIFEDFPVLRKYLHTPARRLSGGEQQQLAIGRALIANPRLLLLDEPSLGLAPKLVDFVFDVLQKLARSGVTILLIEQNARRALAVSDRSYVFKLGRVHMEGSRERFATMAESELEDAYLGIRSG